MYDLTTWFRAAVLRSSRRYSYSGTPSGSASGTFSRMRSGIACSSSASSDAAPIVLSIAARSVSSGPMWRAAKLLCEIRILRGVEQRAGFARVRQLHDDHPAAVRIGVHGFGLLLERGI